ncbi:MAG: hypothetical protein AAGC60_06825 [Acidobacteriota bacterium]
MRRRSIRPLYTSMPSAIAPADTPSSSPQLRAATVLATLVPPVLVVTLVALWGVDLPHWDQFALVPHLEALSAGELALGDLWRPHNEHRLFVPQLLMLALASASGWNVRWELALHPLLALGIFLLAAHLLRTEAGDRRLPPWIWPALSLLVFSTSQWENWTWGWQSQIFLAVLGLLGAVVLLARSDRLGATWAAAACATLASLSFAVGLLVWFAAAPLLLRARSRRQAALRLAVWTAAAGMVITAVLHGLPSSTAPTVDESLPRLLKLFGGYVSLYLGSPVFGWPHVALYGGFVAVVAVAVLVLVRLRPLLGRRGDDSRVERDATLLSAALDRALPWLALLAFGVACACITGYGRLGFGIGQASASRYVTISNMFWLGALGLWLAARPEPSDRTTRRRDALVAVLVGVLLVTNAARGVKAFHAQHAERAPIRAELVASGPSALTEENLLAIFPVAEMARDRLQTLEELGFGPRRDLASSKSPAASSPTLEPTAAPSP